MKKEFLQFIEKHDYFNWDIISIHPKLPEDFIREYSHKLNWVRISQHQILSEDFIREFKNNIDWVRISIHQILSEDFIREFKDKVSWSSISYYQKLSEGFILEFEHLLHLELLVKSDHPFTEFLVDFFQSEMLWDEFFIYQTNIPENVIRRYQDKITWWRDIIQQPHLSEKFIKEFHYKFELEDIIKYYPQYTSDKNKIMARL